MRAAAKWALAVGGFAVVFVAACVALGWYLLADLGYFDRDFVIVNRTNAALTDVRLLAAGQGELARFASIASEETVRWRFSRARAFHLDVEFSDGAGRWASRRVHYIDGDEWGDRRVPIDPGRNVNGVPAARIR